MNTAIGISKTYRGTQTQNNDGFLIWPKKPLKKSTSHVTLKSFPFALFWLHSVWRGGGAIFPPPDKPTCTLIHSLIQFLMAAIFSCPFQWELSYRVHKPWGNCLGTKVIPNLTKTCEPFRVDFQAGEYSYSYAIIYFIYFRGFKCLSL